MRIEKLLIRLWGVFSCSHQFNLVRDFLTRVHILQKLHAKSGIHLQIGDLIIPNGYSYIYQDLNFVFLKHLKEIDPISFSYSGYAQLTSKIVDKRIQRLIRVYEKSSGIFTMSQWLADFIVRDMNITKSKVHHVGGGININISIIDNSIKMNNKILFVGRDFKRKAGQLVVDAFIELVTKYQPDAELYIIGPSEFPLKEHHHNIHFIGEVSSSELPYYFNLCDVFCMPSHFEAYGLVFVEALAFGLPCIGRNKYAMKEFIQDHVNGYLIETDAVNDLALKMYDLLHNEAIKEHVIKNRQVYIEKYSWQAVAERIHQVMKSDIAMT